MRKQPKERFFQYVRKTPNCWIWKGGVFGSNKYGQFSYKGKSIFSHRYSWILHNGEIPKGLLVLHRCDNQICVNPAHLFLGTTLENKLDSVRKKRHAFGERIGASKLTRNDVLKIRELFDQNVSPTEIADHFKIHTHTVYNVGKRLYWKHIAEAYR